MTFIMFSEYVQSSVCSDDQDGQVFIPQYFPDLYEEQEAYNRRFGDMNGILSGGSADELYISSITVPAQCQGNVSSIQFCYQRMSNGPSAVSYMLHFLTRENTDTLRLDRSETVTSQSVDDNCRPHGRTAGGGPPSDIVCCDKVDMNFPLPLGETIIGIEMGANALIATYPPNDQIDFFVNKVDDGAFTLSSSTQNKFPLFRLIVGKEYKDGNTYFSWVIRNFISHVHLHTRALIKFLVLRIMESKVYRVFRCKHYTFGVLIYALFNDRIMVCFYSLYSRNRGAGGATPQ